MLEEVLDRVFDGEDVTAAVLVAVVEHGRERGRFARAGRTHHQNEAALFHHHLIEHGGHAQTLDGGDVALDVAHDKRHRVALPEHVDTKVAQIAAAEGQVELAVALEHGHLRGRDRLAQHALDHVRIHHLLVDRHAVALDLDVDRGARGDEEVRGLLFGHQLEETVENHAFGLRRARAQAPRSSSLMPVLARVCASTFFTITAQYRLYLPQAEGRLPGTTTAPEGTRP